MHKTIRTFRAKQQYPLVSSTNLTDRIEKIPRESECGKQGTSLDPLLEKEDFDVTQHLPPFPC